MCESPQIAIWKFLQNIAQLCLKTSVADPDPGSGVFLTPGPGSGIRKGFFPDPGYRIPGPGSQTHIFESLVTIFWVKSSIIL
jgi:hypothetical protein